MANARRASSSELAYIRLVCVAPITVYSFILLLFLILVFVVLVLVRVLALVFTLLIVW